MKKFVVFFAALLVVISSLGVQGQPNYEPQHYPNVPIGDNSVMNVQEGEQISHLASRFFFNPKNGNAGSHGNGGQGTGLNLRSGRGGNAGSHGNRGHGTGQGGKIGKGGNNGKKVTTKPKLTE